MTDETLNLLNQAENIRYLYRVGTITREEAIRDTKPYLDAVNNKAIEIAKKYNQKPKKVTFNSFMR